jgi:hypothetical protein
VNADILVALFSTLLGGASVAAITQVATRKRTDAEVRKLDAESERTRVETARLLAEIPGGSVRQSPGGRVPGWHLSGSDPDDYNVGTDPGMAHSGSKSGFIASKPQPRGFGTLMQQFSAERYRGMRLRMSAYAKAAEVDEWAALWMRVDGPDEATLAFDNMQDRPISGTTEWWLYQIVLDVPQDAEAIAFGVLLQGSGRVWIDDVGFGSVGKDVPTTGGGSGGLPPEPVNLDFTSGYHE